MGPPDAPDSGIPDGTSPTELFYSDCPSERVHRAFLLGDLSDQEAEPIARHLEACPACEERSRRLDDEVDPVAAALRCPVSLARTAVGDREEAPQDTLLTRTGRRYVAGYEILQEVGRGGMGVVYKARQVRLNRYVALKMILAGRFARPEELVRFHVEGETLARLAHPSIVQVYEIGQADGRPFLAMEWVDGGNLAQRLARAPIPARCGAALVEQLARAVQAAHDSGVVHRDLKPANILLAPEGRDGGATTLTRSTGFPAPKVTDFGLAKPTAGDSDLTETGMVVGTPGYMAPEQARGDRLVGPAADVYSLGTILYEVLTGRPPFPLPGTPDGAKLPPAAVVAQVLDREPVPPRRLASALPRDLATICMRCLEKDPAARYPTARALAEDLRRFLNGEPIWARRPGELERVWKGARRNPVVAGLLAAVAAALIAGAAVSTHFALEAGQQAGLATRARDRAEANGRVAVEARNSAQRQLARADFQEGCRLAELGRVGDGLHWMLSALRQAPDEPEDRPFREVVRLNLGGWLGRLHRLRHQITCPDEIYALAFSPDSRLFAVGGHDRTVRLYRTDTGEPAGPPLAAGARVRGLAFSPDGRWLVAGGDAGYQQGETSRLTRWDLATGREVTSPTERLDGLVAPTIAFSGDGRTFAVAAWKAGTDRPADVWVLEAETGGLVGRWSCPAGADRYMLAPRAAGPGFLAVAYALDAPVWVAGVGAGGSPKWVRVDTFRSTSALSFGGEDRLYVTDPAGTRGYDLPTGSALKHVPPLADATGSAQSPDGRFRAIGARDRGGDLIAAPVRLWETTSGTTQALLGEDDLCQEVRFGPDGRHLLAAYRGGRVRLWDLALPAPRPPDVPTRGDRSSPPPEKRIKFADAVFSRDRSTVALASSNGGIARVWQADRRAAGQDFPQKPAVFVGRGHQVALTPDGRRAFVVAHSGVRAWDVPTGRPLDLPLPLSDCPSALAVDPTGRVLATGGYDRAVHLWDVATGRRVGPVLPQGDIVFAVEFSPDGRSLAVSTYKDWSRAFGARLWEVATGRQVGGQMVTGGVAPARLAFTPDGAQLLTVSSAGVRRWDTRTGAEIGRALTPAGDAGAVAVRPDGRRLLVGTRTGTLRLWDTESGDPVGAVMPAPSAVTALEFHPAGRLAAAGYADGTARLWDTETGHPIGPPIAQPGPVLNVAFLPGGGLRTVAGGGGVRDWPPAPTFDGDPADLERDLVAWTGVRLTPEKVIAAADAAEWEAARRPGTASAADPDRDAALATDAEQAGDPEAARWHLDRLIARGESDWVLFARRGRSLVDAGRPDEAARDYARAAQLAPPGALSGWYLQRSADCRAAERWDDARWYFDRLVETEPDSWRHYAARAEVLSRLGRPDLAATELREAARHGAGAACVSRWAESLGGQGRWKEAADLFRISADNGCPRSEYARALTFLKAGDTSGYRQLCSRAVGETGAGSARERASAAAALCVLGPGAVDDYSRPLALVDRALAELARLPQGSVSESERRATRVAYLHTKGGVLVRAGRWAEGVDCLTEAARAGGGGLSAAGWALRAIASHHLGQPKAAADCLAKVRGWAPPERADASWRRVEIDLLRAEAEALLPDPASPGSRDR